VSYKKTMNEFYTQTKDIYPSNVISN